MAVTNNDLLDDIGDMVIELRADESSLKNRSSILCSLTRAQMKVAHSEIRAVQTAKRFGNDGVTRDVSVVLDMPMFDYTEQ